MQGIPPFRVNSGTFVDYSAHQEHMFLQSIISLSNGRMECALAKRHKVYSCKS